MISPPFIQQFFSAKMKNDKEWKQAATALTKDFKIENNQKGTKIHFKYISVGIQFNYRQQ